MKKIILTGGGTAGHVTPNMALIPRLQEAGFDILYVGSYEGIEKKLIMKEGIPYRGISSGKLRRYFDLRNFTDPFRVLKGFGEAASIIKEFQPDIVFSKGGYVSVPVVRAAGMKHIPVVIHESDMTPGLANKLSYGAATKICCNFPETFDLLAGDKEKARELTGFPEDKPVLLVIGGSLGSRAVNEAVRRDLPALLQEFSVLHLCGKDNLDESLIGTKDYLQFEYVSEELKDYFALADIMVSRAGANSICEILALRKPNVLIPLSAKASRGDQILNARSFENQGYSLVLEEEDMNDQSLMDAVHKVWSDRETYISAMQQSHAGNGVDNVMRLILSLTEDTSEEAQEEVPEEVPEEAPETASEAAPEEASEEPSAESPEES